jgi:hypothetical protein
MTNALLLRDVVAEDLAIFFEQQLDAEASFMAAFTVQNLPDVSLTRFGRCAVVGQHP